MRVLPLIAIGLVITLISLPIIYQIYKYLFDKHNNRVLNSDSASSRRWISPFRFMAIIIAVQFIGIAGVTCVAAMDSPGSGTVNDKPESEMMFDDNLTFYTNPEDFKINDDWELVGASETTDITYDLYLLRDEGDGTIRAFGFRADYGGDIGEYVYLYLKYTYSSGTMSISTENYYEVETENPGTFQIQGTIGNNVTFPGDVIFEIKDENMNVIAEFGYTIEES